MAHDYRARLKSAASEAGAAGVDALLISPSADLAYLVGYNAPLLERLTALIVYSDRDPVLLVPRLERPRASGSPAGGLVEMIDCGDEDDAFRALGDLVAHPGALAVSDRMWALHVLGIQATFPNAKLRTASTVLAKLRMRKDPDEIEDLRRAAASADAAFERISKETLSGRPETDVARSLRQHLTDTGSDEALFWIVGSGPNGASPHHEPGERDIREGDAVVLDFGGRVDGYCSDITRTVSVGEPSSEVREVHAVVRSAQEAAFQAIRPGVLAEDVDRAARRVIEEAGYGDAFVHRTGHGIGLEEHEPPYIVRGNTTPLETGMTFSVEPGIYLAGRFGVRIEDIVAVTEDGAVQLNQAPRELVVLG